MATLPKGGGPAARTDGRLRELMRQKAGQVPITWLATVAGTSPPTIRRLLDGIPVRGDIMLRVFNALDITTDGVPWLEGQTQAAEHMLRGLEMKVAEYVISEETQEAFDEFRRLYREDLRRLAADSTEKTATRSRAA